MVNQVWYLEFLNQGVAFTQKPRLVDDVDLQRLFGFRPAEEEGTFAGQSPC